MIFCHVQLITKVTFFLYNKWSHDQIIPFQYSDSESPFLRRLLKCGLCFSAFNSFWWFSNSINGRNEKSRDRYVSQLRVKPVNRNHNIVYPIAFHFHLTALNFPSHPWGNTFGCYRSITFFQRIIKLLCKFGFFRWQI